LISLGLTYPKITKVQPSAPFGWLVASQSAIRDSQYGTAGNAASDQPAN